jgi:hypothetical protein
MEAHIKTIKSIIGEDREAIHALDAIRAELSNNKLEEARLQMIKEHKINDKMILLTSIQIENAKLTERLKCVQSSSEEITWHTSPNIKALINFSAIIIGSLIGFIVFSNYIS